jgi:hypothetical protein
MGIKALAFAACDEAVERGGPLGGGVMPGEEPVFPSKPHPSQGAFGGVVVDVEVSLRGVDVQRLPLVERLPDGLGPETARQDRLLVVVHCLHRPRSMAHPARRA